MTYVAAFRTHVWDESIALLARRLANACTSSRFVVLADETNGTIDVSGYEKITHTDDARIFGLPKFPSDRLLWYNSDYPLYFLHQAFPGRDYYLLSEYDLAVNTNVEFYCADGRREGARPGRAQDSALDRRLVLAWAPKRRRGIFGASPRLDFLHACLAARASASACGTAAIGRAIGSQRVQGMAILRTLHSICRQ